MKPEEHPTKFLLIHSDGSTHVVEITTPERFVPLAFNDRRLIALIDLTRMAEYRQPEPIPDF
jgi:hypothetical protein